MTTVAPGERLGSETEFKSGSGSVAWRGSIYSVLLGSKIVLPSTSESELPVVTVNAGGARIPPVGANVLCRVKRITRKFIQCDIVSEDTVDAVAYAEPFKGQIKQGDIRLYEECDPRVYYRVGDIIRACVTSAGDLRRGLLLTTARSELGVVAAKSQIGAPLEPLAAQLMRCSLTGRVEIRKVAAVKPTPTEAPPLPPPMMDDDSDVEILE